MRTRWITVLPAATAVAVVAAGLAVLTPAPLAADASAGHAAHAVPAAGGEAGLPPAVDYAAAPFQPGYLRGRTVVYQPSAVPQEPVPDRVLTLYEVEYPAGWQDLTARPQCTYCDHNGNGEDAWDYHDHVLADRPSRADNAAGEVYWHVQHVRPAPAGDPARDAEVARAYAALLPARSEREARALLRATLDDGTPLAEVVDTGFFFRGPLVSR
jgi:hypothetical protein